MIIYFKYCIEKIVAMIQTAHSYLHLPFAKVLYVSVVLRLLALGAEGRRLERK